MTPAEEARVIALWPRGGISTHLRKHVLTG
jgi:hypothetical protein